tara:strand:- start:1643 stop:2182 length:540 start_codon:yes stop_codon:yes gene_type:complete
MSFLQPIVSMASTASAAVAPYATLIATAGTLYSMQQNVALGNRQAALSSFQADQTERAYLERKEQRRKQLRRVVGTQRALYSSSGVSLEGTPLDVFADTAREFAYEDWADKFDSYANVVSKRYEASIYKQSGRQRAFGNLLDLSLAGMRRGTVPSTNKLEPFTANIMDIDQAGRIRGGI